MNIMDSATKTEDVLDVFSELTRIREEIEVIQGRIQYFEQSAAFSAISVDIQADEAVQPITIGGWQPGGVARDAIQSLVDTLQAIANGVIWIGLYVLPTALIVLVPLYLLWRGFRTWRSRRKSS